MSHNFDLSFFDLNVPLIQMKSNHFIRQFDSSALSIVSSLPELCGLVVFFTSASSVKPSSILV